MNFPKFIIQFVPKSETSKSINPTWMADAGISQSHSYLQRTTTKDRFIAYATLFLLIIYRTKI